MRRFAGRGPFQTSGALASYGLACTRLHRSPPSLAPSTVDLFRDEYRLPLVPPELAAPMAAFAEHLFPVLILLGLATRLSATALLVMTLVIQLFVYPDAYATHGTWAAVLLYLMLRGPGRFSLDHFVAQRFAR